MKTGTWLRGLAATACVAATLPAAAEQVTLRVHHFLPTGSTAHAKFITPWCDKINKESAGKLKCQIFPAMQLGGKPPQLIDQARDGIADIVWTLPGYSAGRFPVVEVFELPFMMTSAEATSRAVWDFVQAHDQAEFKDVRPLAFHVHGAGHFFTVKAPITSMADLSGLKLRAPTRLTNMMLGSLGATPVGMPVPQVPEALSKGVIDGAIIPYEVVPAIKVHELTKFASEGDPSYRGLYTTVFVFAMNPAKYDSLPDDLKKVIDANSGIETAALFGRAMDEGDKVGLSLAQKAGNKIHMLDAAETQTWRRTASGVRAVWYKEVGSKGIDGPKLAEEAEALIAKYSKKK